MIKNKNVVFQRTLILIILTHFLFFIGLVLIYFGILFQETESHFEPKTQFFNTLSHNLCCNISIANIKNVVLIMTFLAIASLLKYIYFIKKYIFYPITLITLALETGNKKSIKILKTLLGEFGHIGNLFQTNDNHKYQLLSAKIKAEEGERLKSTFLENLSHEIRTPMNAIIGFTDLMLTTNLAEKDKQEYLTIIHKSGKNLVSIIEDLIEMSKIDTNQIVPNYSEVDIEKCLIELFNTIKVDIPKSKKIDFYILETKSKLRYSVKVDEVKLKQIIINLVYNAIKFTENGYVSFGYEIVEESELDFIKFIVKDTGIGISKENQLTIFDRFKRVESDLTIENGGLGLGLAISRAYVEMMGGRISIYPNQDRGTIFSFTIPLKYAKTTKKQATTEADLLPNLVFDNKTILIAEDDNINFLLIKKMLQITNYNIIRAQNGQEAISKIIENPAINLILMDLKMPVMNGYEAFDKIKILKPNIPIIAQTAHASEEDKEKIYRKGFSDYITKPINKDLLIDMVSRHIVLL